MPPGQSEFFSTTANQTSIHIEQPIFLPKQKSSTHCPPIYRIAPFALKNVKNALREPGRISKPSCLLVHTTSTVLAQSFCAEKS